MEQKERFKKPYFAKFLTQAASGFTKAVEGGFLYSTGVHSGDLGNTSAPFALGPGVIGFFDAKTGLSVNQGSTQVTTGKMLYLASASLMPYDQLASHGGYAESYKSRLINPRFITDFRKMHCAAPEAAVCHLGNTNFTHTTTLALTTGGAGYTDGVYVGIPVTGGAGTGMTVDVTISGGEVVLVEENSNGQNYAATNVLTLDVSAHPEMGVPTTDATFTVSDYGSCNYEFYCDQTYNLQVELGGVPVLNAINQEVPRWVTATGGCCANGVSERIDSTLIFIQWANGIVESPYFKYFIKPIVYDQSGTAWFHTAADAVAAGQPPAQIWANYVSPGYVNNTLGGIRFQSAYVDTQFGNCSFSYSDSIGAVGVVRIMSMAIVDDKMSPCSKQLCFTCEHTGFIGQGFGEDVLREFIDDIPRRGTIWSEDPRFREIEGGDNLFALISRTARYNRYMLVHYIPHNENNDHTFGDYYYELNIYTRCDYAMTEFEALVAAWLTSVNSPVSLVTETHTPFVYAAL